MTEWQPIETAPKDVGILVFTPGKIRTDDTQIVSVLWKEGFGWCTGYTINNCGEVEEWFGALLQPTHWMPLPGHPK